MKKTNPLKKFFLNKGAMIFLAILTVILLVFYSYTFYESSQLSLKVLSPSNSTVEKEKLLKKQNDMQTCSEIALVMFSVFGSAFISSLVIERRNSNKIIEQVFVDDFFTSEEFLSLLDEECQKNIMIELEKKNGFDGSKQKSEMYMAIREKLNKPLFKYDLFYEKYYLNIDCEVKKNYIEKKVIRSVSIQSLSKPVSISNYTLLAMTTPKSDKYDGPAKITKLKIGGKKRDLNVINEKLTESPNPIDQKKGYTQDIKFILKEPLNISNEKPTKIEIEYTTRCPVNDLAYTCRMPYPCRNFDFNFEIKNDDYALNPSAFGFIDDAKNSPNRTDDRKKISIKFDNWIFPLDGVCVYLEKNVAK